MTTADYLPDRQLFRVPYLRAWRRLVGLKQRELALISGIYRTTIVHVEKAPARRVHGGMVNRLADGLGVPPAVLVLHPPTDEALYPVAVQAYTHTVQARLELMRHGESRRPTGGEAA